ncbi:RNA-binding domain-containing protein [Streptomyces sp. NRRL F-5650]|uniref:RNA-binding domain-containing protein n=1 Tax=Streptomyces sp. NRRL F-5650 TaxID=1463868 RepID=UPI0004C9E006|nr:RNA-binding domain-containing protein [Streptomyces sp. NRRL F-5650]
MVKDLKGVLAALDAHEPDSLLGLHETQWLDAKSGPYQLADPKAVEEITKDVAAFANGGGGVIVIGIATRLEHDEEVLDQIVGLDPAAVNADQIRKLLRQRIVPAPRGVRVGWSGSDGERVAFIDVPAQAVDTLFVVPAPLGKPGSPRTDTVAVPMRDGDSTYWLPRTEIQQLLSAGVRASGMPTAQALTELVRQAVSEAGPGSGLRVGQGLPDREREMRAAYEQLTEAGLGEPAGEAWTQGAAALQDLRHEVDGEPGWVLCLVAGRPPVVVAEPVWQTIVETGRRAPGGQDPLAAVGLPRPPAGTDTSWVIPADARSVDLEGGSWGAGRLTCSGRGVWRWQPLPRFSLNQGRSASIGTAGQTPSLRLRALVNLPWAEASTLEISKSRRTQLEQQLPYSAVAGAVTMLSRRRGAELPAARWEPGPFGNSGRSIGYTCTIAGPDGGPAVKASVMLALPTTMESTVVACADVLIENPEAWAAALGPGWDTQLGLDEVQAVLLAAWETAAELLPDVVGDPAGLSWAAPPSSELRMTCEQPADNGVLPGLDTLIDLAPLGPNDGGPRSQLAVAITAAPAMDRAERQRLLREALVHMAHAFGYVDAEVDLL